MNSSSSMAFATRNPEECIAVMSGDPDQVEYVEFSCLYPALEPMYVSWEKDVNFLPSYQVMLDYPLTPVIAVILYGVAIVAGRKYMMNRKPFQWRKAMAAWNLFLCVYSFVAMLRVGLPLLHQLFSLSFRDNLCQDPEDFYARGSTGFWAHSFVWSKFFELLDTLFIIVHKKPLIFLHWYHHVSVLLFTWSAYLSHTPADPIFMSMNAAVHFIMYGYYFLMTVKMRPKWMNAIYITVAQISQMVVGVGVTIMTFYYYFTDHNESNPCQIVKSNLVSSFLMYGSYLYLFVQFFFERYFMGNKKAAFAGKKVA